MSDGLFREEALRTQRTEWISSTRLEAPRLAWVFVSIGLLAILILLGLLLFGRYRRHETVTGVLVPSRGLLTLSPMTPGVVTRIYVNNGDVVHAGQSLAELSGEQANVSLGDVGAAIAVQLETKRSRLRSDLDGQQQAAELQKRDIELRLSLLRQQLGQLEQQVNLQKQRATSAMTLYEQWVSSERTGVVSRSQLLQQHDTALQNLVQYKDLQRQALQQQQTIEELQGQLQQLPASISAKRNEIERQIADVEQSLAQNSISRAVVIRAPGDGTVTNLLVHPGQPVTAQQPLLTILPTDAELLAELWLPPKAIGFVHPGEPVVIRYEAYPYQKFGQHSGRVYEVSRSAIAGQEVSRILGKDVADPRYRVEVILDRQAVLAYGKQQLLRPGMTLDADILLDQRRLIEWVLEPLYGIASDPNSGEAK